MLDNEKIRRGKLIAKVLNLRCHAYYGDDDNNVRYDTTWGDKTPLGLYETVLFEIIDTYLEEEKAKYRKIVSELR